MRLTRRDAVAALVAAGVGVGAGLGSLRSREEGSQPPAIDEPAMEILVAAAEVLYPSAVDGIGQFVKEYVSARAGNRPDRAARINDTIGFVDAYAEAWYDEGFAALERSERDDALRRMGADSATPDPNGSDVERVRYYVVNELLFALYASPTGGRLVGIENPQGHPGGIDSYRRGPEP